MENGGKANGGEEKEKVVEKLCRRCKETFNPSSNNTSSCRFHPSFFVSRRHDDQKRFLQHVGHVLQRTCNNLFLQSAASWSDLMHNRFDILSSHSDIETLRILKNAVLVKSYYALYCNNKLNNALIK
ncbi:PREDICTED: uncharacterized protein LOC104608759 isoform X1 [Nelumbo nucifera]|uniref:Uncharacterized protein LOC104608759 isoform X1 n=1 Tax=Nelumbo nucifera TaxID=4432 RepID=A0A1U8B1R8_NELNU|nr:PREDICTED: uncharacterized protein LOC104608759 isoform X1 [Nelumbo nucifera]